LIQGRRGAEIIGAIPQGDLVQSNLFRSLLGMFLSRKYISLVDSRLWGKSTGDTSKKFVDAFVKLNQETNGRTTGGGERGMGFEKNTFGRGAKENCNEKTHARPNGPHLFTFLVRPGRDWIWVSKGGALAATELGWGSR
jgi:hypothetical protein